jgi:hypothetical protein
MKSEESDSPPPPLPPLPHKASSAHVLSTSSDRIFYSSRRAGIYLSADEEYRDGSVEKLWQDSLRNSDYQSRFQLRQTPSSPSLVVAHSHHHHHHSNNRGPGLDRPVSVTNRAYFYEQTTRQIQQQQQLLEEYEKNRRDVDAGGGVGAERVEGGTGHGTATRGRASSEPVALSGLSPSHGNLKRTALYQPPPIKSV